MTTLPLVSPSGALMNSSVPSVGGILALEGNRSIEARKAAALEANNRPVIQGLAAHVRKAWRAALGAKRSTVEERMLQSVRARRGEYDPDVLADIKKTGGSEIYMMLTSAKCRAAASWIRDVLLGTRNEKPWTIGPTPIPDLPPEIAKSVVALAVQEAQAYEQASGQAVGPREMDMVVSHVKDRITANAKKRAQEACDRMELLMEDQLVEGGFQRALAQFIEDIVTFPAAILKGPVVKKRRALTWKQSGGGYDAEVTEKHTLEWQRVDPMMLYPAAHSTDIDDGSLIERHRLTRSALAELRGVEGYSTDAIDAVLDEYGRGGLHEWLYIDSEKALAEGKSAAAIMDNPEGLIDALQYFGAVQGKLLIEWGLEEAQVPDPLQDYECEIWLVGQWAIKATVNPDPLGRKPYYKASYEEVPGAFWGNSVADLSRDAQSQCNTAARAIANNMGIASGPQVVYNVDRLPNGEDITQLYPWKIHQVMSDPYGAQSRAVDFFAPPLIANELMTIYQFFSALADEHTGVPRYMAGDANAQGALRTSSGISMMMNNAGKVIKQVIANVDVNVLQPLIERLHYYNMMYSDDPALKGDIRPVARGANSLVVKETQQQRINEFMQLTLNSPVVSQIVGEEAIAGLLRLAAKNLDLDTDQIVPPAEIIRARAAQLQQAQQQMAKQQQDFQMALQLAPSRVVKQQLDAFGQPMSIEVTETTPHIMPQPAPGMLGQGAPQQQGALSAPAPSPGQTLQDGTPVTDFFSPVRQR